MGSPRIGGQSFLLSPNTICEQVGGGIKQSSRRSIAGSRLLLKPLIIHRGLLLFSFSLRYSLMKLGRGYI